MRFWCIALISILLVIQLEVAVCSYSFSIRIASARCCSSPGCEDVGGCEDLFIGMCLRRPNTPVENREACTSFIAGNGSDILNRDLTPADIVDSSLDPVGTMRISGPYEGGFQVYIGVLSEPEIPPYQSDVTVDEVFIEVESTAGGGETKPPPVTGERNLVTVSLSLSVDCTPGFGGDDCVTVNTCNEGIICNQTGYCNSEGECICPEGFVHSETGCVEDEGDRGGDSNDSDILPIAVGAGIGGLLLLLLLLILLVVVILLCRRRRYKSRDMYMLTASPDFNSTPTSPPAPPLYSQVNKDKKKRKRETEDDVPPVIPPYQGHFMPYDKLPPASNGDGVRVPDVAYATTMQREGTGYRNVVLESNDSRSEEMEEDQPQPQPQGLVYADLDHEQITTTTFQGPSSPEMIKYSDVTHEPPHEYENVVSKGRAQEVMYSEVK